ncbi:MAG TPA: TonB-dependent receptor, partial [Bacteroidales bacterium]|nr:TonB-dependent receptor [Bacteroidales bacterium]
KWSLIILTILPLLASGQQKYTLSGSVSDASTGEDLTGATVMVAGSNKGTATNSYGFYSLSLPEGDRTIRVSFIGYDAFETKIHLNKDVSLNIELEPSVQTLGEVVVASESDDGNISSAATGVEKLDIRKIETIPVLFGEKDILKTIQLLPGISNASEGSTGFNVRGGSIGHNLILLDEAPVYSSAHLMGFFSVFNSDAIKDVTIYKGGIPAAYGGRASSVVDIVMNNGNSKNFRTSGGIGLVSSRLTVELPVMKERMSLILSGRRTYADLIARTLFKDDVISDEMKFYFYDLNAKINFTVNPRNRIFLSGYFGKDVFDLREDLGTGWGNTTGTLRWNHLLSEKIFSNTSVIYSRFDYGFAFGSLGIRLRSGIEDVSLKEDMTWYIDPDNTLKAGFNLVYHVFRPGELSAGDTTEYKIALREKKGAEGALYLQNEQELSQRLSANYGIRLSFFSQLGPGWFYEYDENNSITDSSFFKKNQAVFPHFLLEPRLSVNYRAGERSSLKASFSRMSQFIHLLSNTTSGTPADVWLPGSNNLKPVIVDQFSAGYFRNFMDNGIEASLEAWYKDIKNTTDYEDGAEIIFNEHVESQILTGRGRGYGLELYIKKKYGEFSGWIGYTLSRTENRIEGINDYKWYPVKYDKTHDLSLVTIYKPGKRLSLSAVWTYATGNAVTFPSGRYVINGSPVPFYTERNGYRMPAYHRLDLSVTLEGRNRKRFKSQWDLSVYNLYNRHNAYMISFRESETVPGATEAVRLSLFGIVPAISYNFKF